MAAVVHVGRGAVVERFVVAAVVVVASEIARRRLELPREGVVVVPQNVVRPRDVSRDDGEGEPAARARSFRCVADGSACGIRLAPI